MKRVGIVAMFVVLSLAACASGGNKEAFDVPSKSMEPTITAGDRVTVNLDAYEDVAPAVGDIIAFHPPANVGKAIECGVRRPPSQSCPKPTSGFSSEFSIKRIVAGPGDEVSIRDGQPVVNGKTVMSNVIQKCFVQACNLPTLIKIPPNHYFVMGDNPRASDDSRYWGPLPRAEIVGQLED